MRIEEDALGNVEVPTEHMWGAQTQRSHLNFPIGVDRFHWGRPVIRALGILKKCAALANGEGTDPQKLRTAMRTVVDQLVDEELILGAAAEAKLEVTDDEVTKALDEVKRQNKLTDKQLETALAQQGYSLREYRKDLKKQILRLRAVNVLVRPRVQVSEDDIKARYERLSGQSSTVTEVHIRHVLLTLPEKPSSDEMEGARRRAGEIVARVRAGEDLGDLAKTLSQDAATKASGGDLGSYKRGECSRWSKTRRRRCGRSPR